MTFTASSENILWLSSALARSAVLVRLIRTRLWRIYRVLSLYLAAYVLRFAVWLFLPPSDRVHSWFFVYSQPVIWILEAAVLIELCFLIFRDHVGLARVGGRVIVAGLITAFVISAATAVPSATPIHDPLDPRRVLFYYTAIERVLDIGMVLFLLVMTAFLCWYPFTLNRNIFVYFAGWAFSFVARSAAVVVPFATGHHVTPNASLALEVIDLFCVISWLVLISDQGERVERVSGWDWQPEHREQIRAQLRAMNAFLQKSRER
jgi:hypothetical protein